ncbi:MAG: class I SAM-dependent methyltransferase [Nitrososphaerales archaeon]
MYYKGEKVEGPITPSTDFHGFGNQIRTDLVRLIPRKENSKVLDVGTGFGSNTIFLAKNLPKGSKIWTIDPSGEVLENVKKKFVQENPDSQIPIQFVQASAAKLDFQNDFFDAIISVMVLHHVEDLRVALKELLRVLSRGGRLLIVDYLPRAGKDLEFQRRHLASDFFESEDVAKIIQEVGGSNVNIDRAEMWYLVNATK